MSWSRVVILVLVGFTLHASHGQQRDRQRGAPVGNFRSFQHNVSGSVWAVDEDKLYVEHFYYDGNGPDAFFWIGNDSNQPTPRGKLIKYPLNTPDGREAVLPRMDGENLVLHLPPGMKVTDMNWLSVWCRRFTVNFGHVNIPDSLEPPRKRTLPEFQRLAHGLRSGNITILDAKTFYIPNLHYDGLGPDAYFWVGRGSKPDPKGHKIPNEMGSLDILRKYEGEDIELQLPDNLTVYDIDYLGVWCVSFKHNFGHVQIPNADDLWVPPSLGQTRIKPDEMNDAGVIYEGDDRDEYLPVAPSSRPGDISQQEGHGTHDPSDTHEKEWQDNTLDFTDSETDPDSGSDPQDGSNFTSGADSDIGSGAPCSPYSSLLLLTTTTTLTCIPHILLPLLSSFLLILLPLDGTGLFHL